MWEYFAPDKIYIFSANIRCEAAVLRRFYSDIANLQKDNLQCKFTYAFYISQATRSYHEVVVYT